MNYQEKSKEELIFELEELKKKHDSLLVSCEKNIDERKQAEEALRKSNNDYRLITENSSDVIWTMDNEYRFTYVSPSVYELRGLTPDEAIQESYLDTLTPNSRIIINEALLEGKENASKNIYLPRQLEIEQYHKDGRVINVEVSIRAMLNEQNLKIGHVGVSRNITKRKIAQKELRESLNRFNLLVTKVPVGIYVFLTRANGHMEFEYVSDRWCEIHHMNREDVLADFNIVNSCFHRDDIDGFLLLNEKAARDQQPFFWEGRYWIKGEIHWFRIESIPISDDNDDIRWYGVAKDITKWKKSEVALRENEEKLRELNIQKDKFFSIIAHDLKSPFHSIMALSAIIAEQIKDNDYLGVEEYAKLIGQSAHGAMDLLTNLLQWAQAHTGRMEFNPESLQLGDLIEENLRLFDSTAVQKSITINKVLMQEITIFADKQMINTVLRNLISNAVKFTKPGGKIKIAAENRSNDVLISVSDNGVGIAPDRLEKLFRLDETFSTPGTNSEQGTGLGLIICNEFIGKHGGKGWVESEQGKGSIFYFTLPDKI